MSYAFRFATRQCALLVLCVSLGPRPALAASEPDLSALNQQLAKDIVKAKLRSVILVDFQDSLGKPSTRGWYVADELSENWLAKKQKFRVIDRSELKDTKVEAEDLAPAMLKRLGSVWGVDAIITGAVETSAGNYIVTATIRRTADNAAIASESITLPPCRVLDVLKPLPDANSGVLQISSAGVNGVDPPKCIECSMPSYSKRARAAKRQGNIILSVLVSEEGRVETIAIVLAMGFGLTQKAVETVSEWRFKPANKEGQTVPVIISVEATWNLY
jgi:TonB family protein